MYIREEITARILEAFDYNNDGWTDVLIMGIMVQPEAVVRVVASQNNKGTFELQTTCYL